MKYSISINQPKACEWGLTLSEAAVFSALFSAQFWAKKVIHRGEEWYWISKGKILQELPILGVSDSAIYKIIKKIEGKGLVSLCKDRSIGKTLIKISPVAAEWEYSANKTIGNDSNTPSEIFPPTIGNGSEGLYKQYTNTSNTEKHITSIPAEVDQQQPETEIVKDMFGSDERKTNDKVCPWEEILDIWAEVMPDKPQPVRGLWQGTRRATDLNNRWKLGFSLRKESNGELFYTDRESGLDWWRRFFQYMRRSDFLMGNTAAVGQRAFTLKIDWVVNKANFVKIMENTYHR